MQIKLAILILLLLPMIMKSQNATATIGNINSCSGVDVLVPIDVTNFNDVGAMTFYIGYDTNAAEFLSIQNINPAIPGSVTYNAINGQLGIAYSNSNPFSISGEKLFDLSFSFLGDSTLLPFNPGTEIANSDLEIIPLDTFPGSIKNNLQLINQPDSVQSYPDNDVTFRVTSAGNPVYQWQENTGSGWIILQDNEIYSGVTNDTLIIFDVSLSFNGYLYRCVVTEGNCNVISDIALLEVAESFPVATLGFISSCPENEVLEPIFVGDFLDVIEFTFNISFNTTYLNFLSLENIHPDLLSGILTTSPLPDPPGLVIHWNSTIPVSITGDKLFDIKFSYESLDHLIAFEEGSEVLNSFLNNINITLNNGSIHQHPVPLITAQPQNDTATEFQNASFTVEASGTDTYLWLISTDGGSSWTSLNDSPPYYNVHTAILTINPAVYSMNEDQFACRLDNEYCTVYSSSGTLLVDTLTYIGSADGKASIVIFPVPFHDNLHISLPVDGEYSLINIYDIHGKLLYFFDIIQNQQSIDINLDLSSLPPGIFLLKLTGTHNGNAVMEQKKILKIN